MSPSKMSGTENERKFVIKHSFENMMNLKKKDTVDGPTEKHFNIPWKIRISHGGFLFFVCLDCMVPIDNEDWSICADISGKFIRKSDEFECKNRSITFTKQNSYARYYLHDWSLLLDLLTDGSLNFEFTVTILDTNGVNIENPKRNFDNESAKETSDVTLIIQGRKFHVSKTYLATHSSYFKSLLLGNFSESGKSEIELKDIDPDDFQYYLEFLYAESFIEAHSVLGILHLADFFDSKTVIRRCQEFLVEKSNLPLKQKFEAAIKYNLEELKNKCISEMKTVVDLRSIVPENSKDFDSEVWKELFLKLLSISK